MKLIRESLTPLWRGVTASGGDIGRPGRDPHRVHRGNCAMYLLSQ